MSSPLGLVLYDIVKDGQRVPNTNVGKHQVFSTKATDGKIVGTKMKSLFGRSVFTPFPTQVDKSGTPTDFMAIRNVHSTETYDTSVSSLVKYTSKKRGQKLRFADFAYLKNLGVYPNNRLIIARRFPGPVGNDLNRVNSSPLATMISWFNEEDQDWFKLSYNEKWVAADVDFTNVLNEVGDSLSLQGDADKSFLGKYLAGGLNILPFGGFSEPLQRLAFRKLGFVSDPYNLPLGNPNLIREALRRETQSKSEPGSGLACDIEINMTVEYEQKFINNVDPTIVYLDIIQNALTFGTSDAAFQMSGGFGNVAGGLLNDLIGGNFSKIFEKLKDVLKGIFDILSGFAASIMTAIKNPATIIPTITGLIQGAFDFVGKSISSIIGKFKVRLNGIIHALTGSPSTPWHITIGNPKRPFFSSGDMLLKTVSVKFGTTLAFNDLPSTISFDLTFANARPLGANEIFNRLNTGKGRSYIRVNVQKDLKEDEMEDELENNEQHISNDSLETYPDNKGAEKSNNDKVTYDTGLAYSSLGEDIGKAPDWLTLANIDDTTTPAAATNKNYTNPSQNTTQAPSPPVVQAAATQSAPPPSSEKGLLQQANSDSKKGYTYELAVVGPWNEVRALDKDGALMGTSNRQVELPQLPLNIPLMIREAQVNANDI